ncbi:hypothetical protein HKW90_04075 [Pseudomonas aeruginosa]|nr:hypothetical protein [Pseudomonas aeruginosa]
MTATQASLASRAKAWLETPRGLAEIQDAHSKLLGKIERDSSVDPEDGKAALGELIEGYVDAGGDMFDLYQEQAPLVPPTQARQESYCSSPKIDLSPLSPDVPPGPPLTQEQKAKALREIRAILGRPKQASA